MEKRHSTYLILGCMVWAILGTLAAAYYYVQYSTYRREYTDLAKQLDSVSIRANVLISYGNGTRVWHNSTLLPLNSTAFTALNATADSFDYEGSGGTLYITSINGVTENSTYGWMYWVWDTQDSEWKLGEYSAAVTRLHEGDTVAYAFTIAQWPPPPPT